MEGCGSSTSLLGASACGPMYCILCSKYHDICCFWAGSSAVWSRLPPNVVALPHFASKVLVHTAFKGSTKKLPTCWLITQYNDGARKHGCRPTAPDRTTPQQLPIFMAKGKKSRATRTDSSLGRPQYASAPTHGSRYDKRIHVLGLHGEEPRELTLDETKCLLVDWHAKPKPLTLTLTMMDPLRPLFGLANYAGNVGSMLCSHPRPRMQTASEAHETTSVTELESIAQAPTHVFEVISLSPVSTHTAQFVNGGAREAIDAVEAMYTGRSWHTRQGIGALRLTEISAWRSDALSRVSRLWTAADDE